MWITAVNVLVVGCPPKGFLTWPVEVIVQFAVDESKTPEYDTVPPS
jgi:hypothetical protein